MLSLTDCVMKVETAPGGQFRSVCQVWGKDWTLQFESFVHVGRKGLSLMYDSKNAAEVVFKDGDRYHMKMVGCSKSC